MALGKNPGHDSIYNYHRKHDNGENQICIAFDVIKWP